MFGEIHQEILMTTEECWSTSTEKLSFFDAKFLEMKFIKLSYAIEGLLKSIIPNSMKTNPNTV